MLSVNTVLSISFGCTYIKAVVIIPHLDPRDVEVRSSFHIPDDKIQLDGRVERTSPHVTLFCGLKAHRYGTHANYLHQLLSLFDSSMLAPLTLVFPLTRAARFPGWSVLRMSRSCGDT